MQTKSSLMSLLTISGERETVFFAHCKELEDSAPSDLFWYDKKGANGRAEYIWGEKQLKQWLFVGNDEQVREKWLQLLEKKHLSFSWGEISIDFDMPDVKLQEEEENFVKIKSIPLCGKNDALDEYVASGFLPDIGFLLGELSNCAFLEGYKVNDSIKPIVPYGLLAENTLAKFLEKNVRAVFDKRGFFWQLRGSRSSENQEGTRRYSGFLQASEQFRNDHRICIRNLKGDKTLGVADLEIKTGEWATELNEDADKGQFLIQEKASEAFVCGEKFYLIKDIKINTNVVHTILKDFFGREITISDKMETVVLPESVIWDAKAAPDNQQSQMELSDRLTQIFVALGKKITFVDPYFWGNVTQEADQFKLSLSQQIFLNALVTALAKGRIEEIVIIGYWQRANDLITGDRDTMINNYRLLYKLFLEMFRNSSLLVLRKFEIVFSRESFHDRYWMGENDLLHISNSINGAFASGELSIKKEDDLSRFKVKPRIDRRYANGEKHNLIDNPSS